MVMSNEQGRRRCVLAVAFALAASGCGTMNRPPPPLPLAGTLWTLQELTGMPVPATEAGVGPTLQIDAAERRVAGSTGVNRYMGGATFDAATLSFSAIAASRRAGPLPAMAVERSLLAALEATRAYRISGAQLVLLDGSGELLARFAGSAR
jgi:heat shock protein HslJ